MEPRKLTKEDIDKVRNIEGFPIGTDEDIIALSDAPYYTACPNPFIEEFIKENAMEAQDEDFYKKKMAEYNAQKADADKVLHDLQDKRAARLSRKELLEGLIRTLSNEGIVTDTFDGKLWLLLVEKATVGTDEKLTFTLRNGMEIEV